MFERYGQKMYGIALRYSAGPDDAYDLLQDSFIKIFDNISAYNGQSHVTAWMSRVIINLAITKFRKQKRGPQFVDLDDSGYTAAEEDEMVAETYPVQEVLNAIQQLSPKYRLIINLYAMEKMGHKEIAEQLGISQGTSKSQLSRARMMLKQILEKKKKFGSE